MDKTQKKLIQNLLLIKFYEYIIHDPRKELEYLDLYAEFLMQEVISKNTKGMGARAELIKKLESMAYFSQGEANDLMDREEQIYDEFNRQLVAGEKVIKSGSLTIQKLVTEKPKQYKPINTKNIATA